jgi:hypothetical protein
MRVSFQQCVGILAGKTFYYIRELTLRKLDNDMTIYHPIMPQGTMAKKIVEVGSPCLPTLPPLGCLENVIGPSKVLTF